MQQGGTCSSGTEKINISDLNGCIFWFIKHFIGLRLILRALYSPAEIELSNRDTFCLGLDFRIVWSSAALQQNELSVLVYYRRLRNVMQLTCTFWMQSDNPPTTVLGKHIAPVKTCVSNYPALPSFHLPPFARCSACNKHTPKLCRSLTTQNT